MAKVTAIVDAPSVRPTATWEEKCRAAWKENAAIEAERLSMAQQIHDLNRRLTYDPTSKNLIEQLRADLTRQSKDYDKLVAENEETLAKLADANARIEPVDIDMDAEVEALTEVIRAAKAIRRRWRG